MKLESLKNVQELQVKEASQIKGGGRDTRGGTTSNTSPIRIEVAKKNKSYSLKQINGISQYRIGFDNQ